MYSAYVIVSLRIPQCAAPRGIHFASTRDRGNIVCKRIPVTSAGLQKNGNRWKSLGGILVNIVPWEVPRPKTFGACGPLVFWPWNSLGTIFTRIPP